MNWNGEVLFNGPDPVARAKNKEQRGMERQEAIRSSEPNLAFTINRGFNRQPIIKHVR